MSEHEFKVEWLFINLRWFFLLAVAGIIGIEIALKEEPFPPVVLVLLIVGGVANLLLMIFMLLNAFRKPLPPAITLLDIALTLGFMAGYRGTESPLLFVSMIPIISTALRASWVPSLLVAGGIVGVYWAASWVNLGLPSTTALNVALGKMFPFLINGVVLLVAGGAVSNLGSRIKLSLEKERVREKRESEAALAAAHQRVRLIFELASTLSATLSYERVLEAALDVSNAGLREFFSHGGSQIAAILLFSMDRTLYVATSRGLSPQDTRARFPGTEGILARALDKAEPALTNDPGADPELSRLVSMHHCRQAIAVPMRAGFESYGLLLLGSPEPAIYVPDFQDLLVAVCNQAVMALQNARLYEDLMADKERLVAVDEDARKRLARDLHDGPTQTFAAITMRFNYIRMLIQKDPEKAQEELAQVEELSRKTVKEIRQLLFTLRPLILETQGLVPALSQYIQKLAETDPLPIHLEAQDKVDEVLDKEAQGALFYTIEEAITNARKHAKANNLWIRLYQRGMSVIAEVEDDGKGFDVAEVEEKYAERSSLGMMNLRERSTLVGGKTVIQSTPGKGTRITVTIPIRKKA